MKKLISAIILCEAASLWGAAALDETTKILTFDVAEGVSETYSDDLTADVAGIVKNGAGTVVIEAANTGFKDGKTVAVNAGALEIRHKDALGSGNTVTVAGGAQYRMVYDTKQKNKDGQNNDIVLEGGSKLYLGYMSNGESGDYFLGNVKLAGDATVETAAPRGFGRKLDLGGYTLTHTGSKAMLLSGAGQDGMTVTVTSGTIVHMSGTLTIQGAPEFKDAGLIRIGGGATINMWNVSKAVPWNLEVESGTGWLQMGRGLVSGKSANPAANVWSGGIEIKSGATLSFKGYSSSYAGDFLSIDGVISGDGAVTVPTSANGAVFQFRNANTYTGVTKIEGSRLRLCKDGAITGAVQIYNGQLDVDVSDGCCTADGLDSVLAKLTKGAYSDARGRIGLFVSDGQSVSLANDFSGIHPSVGIQHLGAGTLTLTGKMPSGTMFYNNEGTYVLDGDVTRVVWGFQCISGLMDLAGGTIQRGYYDGNRSYKIGGDNDAVGARMRVLDGGKLIFPLKDGGSASETVLVEDIGKKPAVLEIQDGAVVTAKVQIASSSGSKGAVYQYGGDVMHLSQAGNDGIWGNYGQAYYGLYGGSFTVKEWLAVARVTNSVGRLDVTGGEFRMTNGPLILSRSASRSEMNVTGGDVSIPRIVFGEHEYSPNKDESGGLAVLTLSGPGNPLLTAAEVMMCQRTNEFTAVLNLNAGTIVAGQICKPYAYRTYRSEDCKAFVNFNGGTLRITDDQPFGKDEAYAKPTRVTIFEKGATVDTNGRSGSNYIYTELSRPEGRGVMSITLPQGAATTGYAMPPCVTISGGGGEGATATALFDPQTGTLTGIEVTCPGWNYTEAPTVTVKAPDMETDVVCEVALTEGDQQPSGGLTKTGAGILVLMTPCTYTGPTVIKEGILYPQVANPIMPESEIRLQGGQLSTWNAQHPYPRIGGYGKLVAWDNNYSYVTDAMFFKATDLDAGRNIESAGGDFKFGDGCKIEIEGLADLKGESYTLLDVTSNKPSARKILGTGCPELAVSEGSDRWKVYITSDRRKLRLMRRFGMRLIFK